METLLYILARVLIGTGRRLPLRWVAQLGRWGGVLAFHLDGRHRRVALENLRMCFGAELSSAEIRKLARENLRRIGESFACGMRTAFLSPEQLWQVVEVRGAERLQSAASRSPSSLVVAIGHFGNFELYTRLGSFLPGFQGATTYRALRQPSLNRLLQHLRQRSGCLFFERRSGARALRQAMSRQSLLLGLLADQHAGDNGLRLPFFGRDCSTSAAPALFALRYRCPLLTAISYRVGLARWRLEVGEEIASFVDGQPRSVEAISQDMNRAFEIAVRRDPANWFWVHRRWKSAGRKVRAGGNRPYVVGRATSGPS